MSYLSGKVSAFHCAVSAHSLKEEEEGQNRGSKHPQGRLSGVVSHSRTWRKRGWDRSHTRPEFLESAGGR